MEIKKITIFAGHYGSGKSNLAVNFAMLLRDMGKRVTLCDLDIVNPYFRSKDSAELLEKRGISLISSVFANSNLDVPAFPESAYSMFSDDGIYYVVDLGGDDRGAYALGRFSEMLRDYHMLLVINRFRPDTADENGVREIVAEIQSACRVKFTSVVNNTNLGPLTTREMVLESAGYAGRVCDCLGLPLYMTSYNKALGNIAGDGYFPIEITKKEIWEV